MFITFFTALAFLRSKRSSMTGTGDGLSRGGRIAASMKPARTKRLVHCWLDPALAREGGIATKQKKL
jgi:hypothetical protein